MSNINQTMLDGITTILFDIDNTLLYLPEKEFMAGFIKLTYNYFNDVIAVFEQFSTYIIEATNAIITNNNRSSEINNARAFSLTLAKRINLNPEEIEKRFLSFYEHSLDELQKITRPIPLAKEVVLEAAKKFDIAAATNPFFPLIANEKRLKWAGLEDVSWLEISSAENYNTVKPFPDYYEALLKKINKKSNECLLVGNDPVNDVLGAKKIGIKTLIVKTDHIFDKLIKTKLDNDKEKTTNIKPDYIGTFNELYHVLKKY